TYCCPVPGSTLFPYTTLFRSRGGERPASGVSVDSRAARTSSVITKVPGASGRAHTTRGSGGEGEALSNYRVRRTSGHGYCQLGADGYGRVVRRGHAQIISRGVTSGEWL